MASTRAYCDRVLGRLLPFGPVEARAMFGGFGLYREGVMFALIARDALYFKADDANREEFRNEGATPFVYENAVRRVEMSYWRVPASVFDDPERLAHWAGLAVAAAKRSRPARRRSREKRSRP